MNEPPVGFAGQGIDVLLAQEAHGRAFFEGVHGGRVRGTLARPLVETNSPHILFGTVHAFNFFVAAQIACHNRRGDRQRKYDQRYHHNNSEEHVAGFTVMYALLWSRHRLAHGFSP